MLSSDEEFAPPPVKVRFAKPEDENAIFFLLLDMAAENSPHKVSAQKALDHIRHVISVGAVAIAEQGGEIIGTAGVSLRSPWFSDEQFLGDSWFFVRSDKRSSRAALLLKKTMFKFADDVGRDLVFAVFSTEDPERKSKFFARDMKPLGGAFVKETK